MVTMFFDSLKVKALAVVCLLLALASAWGWTLAITRGARAEAAGAGKAIAQEREARAVQVAQDAADYGRQVREMQAQCEAEHARLRDENRLAVIRAREEGEAEGREQEAYERKLANPERLDPGCQEILTARVCPDLMNY